MSLIFSTRIHLRQETTLVLVSLTPSLCKVIIMVDLPQTENWRWIPGTWYSSCRNSLWFILCVCFSRLSLSHWSTIFSLLAIFTAICLPNVITRLSCIAPHLLKFPSFRFFFPRPKSSSRNVVMCCFLFERIYCLLLWITIEKNMRIT